MSIANRLTLSSNTKYICTCYGQLILITYEKAMIVSQCPYVYMYFNTILIWYTYVNEHYCFDDHYMWQHTYWINNVSQKRETLSKQCMLSWSTKLRDYPQNQMH